MIIKKMLLNQIMGYHFVPFVLFVEEKIAVFRKILRTY